MADRAALGAGSWEQGQVWERKLEADVTLWSGPDRPAVVGVESCLSSK